MNSNRYTRYTIASKHRVIELRHFALQYEEFKKELATLPDISAVLIDGMPHSSVPGDPTPRLVARKILLQDKIACIDIAASLCHPNDSVQKAVLYAVTHEGASFDTVKSKGMLYYERDVFYVARRKFFYELDKLV